VFLWLLVGLIEVKKPVLVEVMLACDRRWWLMVLARWEEFEQHEESMGQIHHQQLNSDQSEVVKPPLSSSHDNSAAPAALAQTTNVVVQRRPVLHDSTQTSYASPPAHNNTAISVQQHSVVHGQQSEASGHHWFKQMTNRAHVAISSVLGQSVRRYDDLRPPGLRNPNQNVCFLNAIIQALAHTPCLPETLTQLRRTRPHDLLVCHLTELLERLSAPVSTSVPLVVDSSNFRMQASLEFAGGLIERPHGTPAQRQQDAAECLTWMVEWLHSRMSANAKTSGTQLSTCTTYLLTYLVTD